MGAIPVVEALTTDPNPNPIPQDCLAMGAIPVFFHETQLAIWPDAAGSWLRDAVIFIDQKDVQAPYHLTILPSYHPTILPSYHPTLLASYPLIILPSYQFTILPTVRRMTARGCWRRYGQWTTWSSTGSARSSVNTLAGWSGRTRAERATSLTACSSWRRTMRAGSTVSCTAASL